MRARWLLGGLPFPRSHDLIQHAYRLVLHYGLRMRKQVISEFPGLSETHRRHCRAAVLVAGTEKAINRFSCCLRHEPPVVGRVSQVHQS